MNLEYVKHRSGKSYSDIATACDMQRGYACRAVLHPELVSYKVFKKIATHLGLETATAAAIWKTAKEEHAEKKTENFIQKKLEE